MTKDEIFDVLSKYSRKTLGLNSAESCVYYDSKTGNRCAIGALLSVEDAKYLEEHYTNHSIQNLFDILIEADDTNPNKLPDTLKALLYEHGPNFLQVVQNFHDNSKNWTDTGMSDDGLIEFKQLKENYGQTN